MQKVNEEEEVLTDKRKSQIEEVVDTNSVNNESAKKKKKKSKKKKNKRNKKDEEDLNKEKETMQESRKKTAINNDQFIISDTFNLIKMLGFGTFGEIHLAYDTMSKQLRAIKFEIASQKNPQLKHEYSILQQLNMGDDKNSVPEGIPRVYGFNKIENKCNYMIMDFLGPSLSDLFQFRNKQFSLKTVCLLAIQMLQRIEYIHEKGFIHRDIKPENFVIGLNEKSNVVHIIDFGLSKRYKDKNTSQHIPYRENRHLVGTARYASLNAHLGIEQSRRDDIESIGYVLVYFYLGRLPWQSKQEKGKQPAKIMEKKLITPPEILCKKMPMEFSYYFHYCKNLKYEDRPDYSTLKSLFYDLLMTQENINIHYPEFTFDWFEDDKKDEISGGAENNTTGNNNITSGNPNIGGGTNHSNPSLLSPGGKKKAMFELDNNAAVANNNEENADLTPDLNKNEDMNLINFKDINSNFQSKNSFNKPSENLASPAKDSMSFDVNGFLNNHVNTSKNNPNSNPSIIANNNQNPNIKSAANANPNLIDLNNNNTNPNTIANKSDGKRYDEDEEGLANSNANTGSKKYRSGNEDLIQLKSLPRKQKNINQANQEDDSWSVQSSDQDTIQDNNIGPNDDNDIKKMINASESIKNENSDSHYKLLTSSEKSSEERKKLEANKVIRDDEIVLKMKKTDNSGSGRDVVLNVKK